MCHKNNIALDIWSENIFLIVLITDKICLFGLWMQASIFFILSHTQSAEDHMSLKDIMCNLYFCQHFVVFYFQNLLTILMDQQ